MLPCDQVLLTRRHQMTVDPAAAGAQTPRLASYTARRGGKARGPRLGGVSSEAIATRSEQRTPKNDALSPQNTSHEALGNLKLFLTSPHLPPCQHCTLRITFHR